MPLGEVLIVQPSLHIIDGEAALTPPSLPCHPSRSAAENRDKSKRMGERVAGVREGASGSVHEGDDPNVHGC
jgi:hypothetical protein